MGSLNRVGTGMHRVNMAAALMGAFMAPIIAMQKARQDAELASSGNLGGSMHFKAHPKDRNSMDHGNRVSQAKRRVYARQGR